MVSPLDFVFLNLAFTMLFVGLLMNTVERYLPLCIVQNFRYGKFADRSKVQSKLKAIEFPKSSFRHFYAVALISVTGSLIYSVYLYYFNVIALDWILSFIDLWCGSDRRPAVSPLATVLSLFLLTIQCVKRFYETYYVQIFSKTSKINLFHYLVGHFHYFGCILAIMSRSYAFTDVPYHLKETKLADGYVLFAAIPAIFIFVFAWTNQFQSNIILANLRKDPTGRKVVSEKHHMPVGGLFEYVSSPHLFCEVLIYVALTLLLVGNFSWWCVTFWVLSNQIETALLSHWWYHEKFPEYPKARKAIIPFVL